MNDTTQTGLGSAFGAKTRGAQVSYGHPYAREILDSAKETILSTETGRTLTKSCDLGRVPINVIKGLGAPGFSAESRIIYLQVPGKSTMATPKMILQLVKAMREADQDLLGMKTPDPSKDIMHYATVMHAKNMDSIVHVCKFAKELTNSSGFTDFLDALDELGYKKVYQAYLEHGTDKEAIFRAYADS